MSESVKMLGFVCFKRDARLPYTAAYASVISYTGVKGQLAFLAQYSFALIIKLHSAV